MIHIDKAIYNQSGVVRHLNHLSGWYYGCALVGVVCTVLFFLFPNLSGALSALLLMAFVIGDFFLLITLCYYLFGDRYQAFDKNTGTFLERTSDYYPINSQPQLLEAFESQSLSALNAVKRGTTTQLLVIRYNNDDHHMAYCQLFELHGEKVVPITDVCQMK